MSKIKLTLLSNTENPVEVIAMAGKLCYSKSNIEDILEKMTSEQTEAFVNRLVSYGHESPLEHISFTFGVEGISRACSHQMVRHRIASYSQQSQRYVDLKETFDYVTPKILFDMDEHYSDMGYVQDFQEDMEMIHDMYTKWQRRIEEFVKESNYPTYGMTPSKVANENARSVLPNACETKLVFTMNLRTLIHFIKHRKCRRAQEEIRELAILMEQVITEKYPIFSNILGAPCQLGKCPEGNMTCKMPYEKIKK